MVDKMGQMNFDRKRCRVVYLRQETKSFDVKGHPVGSVAYFVDRENEVVYYQVMSFNPKDTFRREIGYNGVITRLQRSPIKIASRKDARMHEIVYNIMTDIVKTPRSVFSDSVQREASRWIKESNESFGSPEVEIVASEHKYSGSVPAQYR
jgi:hypothetical protein